MIHETNINNDFKQQHMRSLHMNHYDYFQKHVVITIVRIHTHTLRIVALRLATLQALALQEDFPDADFLWKQEAPKSRAK